jgi:hypothetical protein
MTLSPMEPNVSANYCKGLFSLQDPSPWRKCEEMGLKEPNICILSKVTAMSALCSAENPFQVKIAGRRAALVFNGED